MIGSTKLVTFCTLLFVLFGCPNPDAPGLHTGKPVIGTLDSPNLPTITIDPSVVLHNGSSYVIGFNRNHVPGDFPNGAAKLQKMKELTPTWGQKKMLYRNGHGPTDGHLDFSYMTGYHFADKFGSNGSYPYDTAVSYPYDDLRNALYEANTMGADQLHVINFGTSDENEAGAYVSYLNRSSDTNRTTHPYAQQNTVLFELGNEITWDAVRGHDPYAMDENLYATRGKVFAKKMRSLSDVPIKIGLSLSVNTSFTATHWPRTSAVSLQNMINIMGSDLDFITYHGYSGWPMKKSYAGDSAPLEARQNTMATIFSQLAYGGNIIETKLLPVLKAYNQANSRDLYLLNSEFFSNIYENPGLSRGMYGALFSAATAVQALRYDIRGTINFCLSHGDISDSLMFIHDDPNKVTAVFRFLRLLANHWGDQVVESLGTNIPTQAFTNNGKTVNLPRLQFATASKSGKVYVLVVNVLNDAHVLAKIQLPTPPLSAKAYTLSGIDGYFSKVKVSQKPLMSPSI